MQGAERHWRTSPDNRDTPPYRKKALTGGLWIFLPLSRETTVRHDASSHLFVAGCRSLVMGNRTSRAAPCVPVPTVTDAFSALRNTMIVPPGIGRAVFRIVVRPEALAVKRVAVGVIPVVNHHYIVMFRLKAGEFKSMPVI